MNATFYTKLIVAICIVNALQLLGFFWDYDLCNPMRGGTIVGLHGFDESSWCQLRNFPDFFVHSPLSRESPVDLHYYVAELIVLLGIAAAPLQFWCKKRVSAKLLFLSIISMVTQLLFRIKLLSYGGLTSAHALNDPNFWGWTLALCILFILWFRQLINGAHFR